MRGRSGRFVRAEIKLLFVIHEADLQVIEKANAPDDIDGEVFWFSEVNRGLSFQLANGERDFVAVGIERTCCRAKALRRAICKV